MDLLLPLARFYEMCTATVFFFVCFLSKLFFIPTINSTTSTKNWKATRPGLRGEGGGRSVLERVGVKEMVVIKSRGEKAWIKLMLRSELELGFMEGNERWPAFSSVMGITLKSADFQAWHFKRLKHIGLRLVLKQRFTERLLSVHRGTHISAHTVVLLTINWLHIFTKLPQVSNHSTGGEKNKHFGLI